MAISFDYISSNIRSPLVYNEVTNRLAGYFVQNTRVLLIGQTTNASGSEAPVLVPSADWVKQNYGVGSQIARMVEAYKQNNSINELWIMPLHDAAGSTAATLDITFSGTPTANGTVSLYIAGDLVSVGVTSGDSPTAIATNTVAAINLQSNLPVIATNSLGVVTLTAKNKGTVGNKIPVVLNFLGQLANQVTPAGLTVTLASSTLSGGATDPSLDTSTGKLSPSNIGNTVFTFYGHPYADTSSLGYLTTYFNDATGTWSPTMDNHDGHAWTAVQGSVSALQTLGTAINGGKGDQHQTVIGYETACPEWSVDVVGAYVGQAAAALSIDPARTLQTLQLISILPVPEGPSRFSIQNHETLLNAGIATISYKSGAPAIERSITTYQKNSYGQPDPSYLDVETLALLSFLKKSITYRFTQKFPRMKLAADGTKFGQGQAIVTPSDIKAEILSWYDEMIAQGFCQNYEDFKANTIVELDSNDPNRVNVQLVPTLVNNLRVIAVQTAFKLRVN